jgi:inosine/xanthosine triphosphate pyrophosphatase family protein
MTRHQITAATANPAKLRELQQLVGEFATVIRLPADLRDPAVAGAPDEDGETVEQIARAKAVGWSRILSARALDSLTIASDGGLLIPALGDAWDPRFTRRFAGAAAADRDRCERLLDLTRRLTGDERAIAWQEAVAIADRGELVGVWSASGLPGRLILDSIALGSAGTWFPPPSGADR